MREKKKVERRRKEFEKILFQDFLYKCVRKLEWITMYFIYYYSNDLESLSPHPHPTSREVLSIRCKKKWMGRGISIFNMMFINRKWKNHNKYLNFDHYSRGGGGGGEVPCKVQNPMQNLHVFFFYFLDFACVAFHMIFGTKKKKNFHCNFIWYFLFILCF